MYRQRKPSGTMKRCASCHLHKPFDSFSTNLEPGNDSSALLGYRGILNASCDDCIELRSESSNHRGIPKVKGRILAYPNYILTLVASEVLPTPLAKKVVEKLFYAAAHVKWGVVMGLAAPQIGYSVRVFIIGETPYLNPIILTQDGFYEAYEGCYSLAREKYDYRVTRPLKLTLSWQDMGGSLHQSTFQGQMAQIISHEVDHLNGILLINQPKVSVV